MKKLFLTFGFMLFVGGIMAQNILVPKQSGGSPWSIGGNIGVSGQNGGWDISLAPRLGYQMAENLEAGFNINYTFGKQYSTKYQILGIGPEINYHFSGLFAGVAYLYNSVWTKSKFGKGIHIDENALFLGGGYRHHIGGNTYLMGGIRYNVLYKKEKSIFSSAFLPYFGVSVGL